MKLISRFHVVLVMLLDLSEGASLRRRHCASGAAGYPCKMCTAGRYSPWYARQDSLYENQYGHVPECEECEAGRYSTAGADECRYCPADTFSKSGWSECFDCPAGKTSLEDYASTGCKSYDVWLIAFLILCPFTVISCCIAGYVIYRHMQPRKNVTGPAAGEPAPAAMGRSKPPEEI